MFFKRKIVRKSYDPDIRKPAIRVSICTREKVAGFKNLKTGKFEEIMLLNSEKDLKEFKETYGIEGEIEKFY